MEPEAAGPAVGGDRWERVGVGLGRGGWGPLEAKIAAAPVHCLEGGAAGSAFSLRPSSLFAIEKAWCYYYLAVGTSMMIG